MAIIISYNHSIYKNEFLIKKQKSIVSDKRAIDA